MTRPIVAASFLAGITAAGLTGRAAMRRWFTAARQVEQAPLEPYLPPRDPVAFGQDAAATVLQSIDDDLWLGIIRENWKQSAADRAMPEVGE